jgi:two-component system LytT family response regulator
MRVLIVDDEPIARRGMRRLLEQQPGVEIVGEYGDGAAAIEAIVARTPDLVFLDVQMPGLSGFDVIERVGPEAMPGVVFVTAYDRHALRAFEVHAIDYLLKPLDPDRFRDALERAARALARERTAEAADRLDALLRRLQAPSAGAVGGGDGGGLELERLVVREGGRLFFVAADELDWIEAAGNYVKLHAGSKTHLVRHTMDRLARRLGRRFVRIRRSALVNVRAIATLEPYAKGSFTIALQSGVRLTSSRYYLSQLKTLLSDGRPS